MTPGITICHTPHVRAELDRPERGVRRGTGQGKCGKFGAVGPAEILAKAVQLRLPSRRLENLLLVTFLPPTRLALRQYGGDTQSKWYIRAAPTH